MLFVEFVSLIFNFQLVEGSMCILPHKEPVHEPVVVAVGPENSSMNLATAPSLLGFRFWIRKWAVEGRHHCAGLDEPTLGVGGTFAGARLVTTHAKYKASKYKLSIQIEQLAVRVIFTQT